MNHELVTETVNHIWSTALSVPVQKADQQAEFSDKCIAAEIELSGDVPGLVRIECEWTLAELLARRMIGLTESDAHAPIDPLFVTDALGELANLTAGGLRRHIPVKTSMSLPVVSQGQTHNRRTLMKTTETTLIAADRPVKVTVGLDRHVSSDDTECIHVLLVEDSRVARLMVKGALESVKSDRFELTSVDRLDQAIDILNRQKFDIVLLDLTLPDSSGLETCQRLRQKTRHVPIIVLTSNEDEAFALQALKSGAQDYLLKSEVAPALLARSIRYAIERARAERINEEHQQEMLKASRQAGIAEMATGILHNVGNVLNSVGVSVSILQDRLKKSSANRLTKAAEIVQEHQHDLGRFVTEDDRGKMLPSVLMSLANRLKQENEAMSAELADLRSQIDHVKTIVSAQQSLAKPSGFQVQVNLEEIIKELLTSHSGLLRENRIEVVSEFAEIPAIWTDKHKVIQVIGNLILNAIDAIVDQGAEERMLRIQTLHPDEKTVEVRVTDSGIGIPPENISRIFQHGFTTKEHGHGFGLHSSANSVTELGGQLTATSPGPGQGATFSLTLPIKKTE